MKIILYISANILAYYMIKIKILISFVSKNLIYKINNVKRVAYLIN